MNVGGRVKEMCSGCSACMESCPRNCIKMMKDEEGFLYPIVNNDLCSNCQVCLRKCPFEDGFKPVSPYNRIKKVYAGYSKDEKIRCTSSSGGVFSLFAQYIIVRGGGVRIWLYNG